MKMKMTKTEVKIAVRVNGSKVKKVEYKMLPGYAFNYKGIEMVVHRPLGEDVVWGVTEPHSGTKISRRDMPTRAEAVEHAKELVDSIGVAKIKEAFQRALKALNRV